MPHAVDLAANPRLVAAVGRVIQDCLVTRQANLSLPHLLAKHVEVAHADVDVRGNVDGQVMTDKCTRTIVLGDRSDDHTLVGSPWDPLRRVDVVVAATRLQNDDRLSQLNGERDEDLRVCVFGFVVVRSLDPTDIRLKLGS